MLGRECPECESQKISMNPAEGIFCMVCGHEIAGALTEIG